MNRKEFLYAMLAAATPAFNVPAEPAVARRPRAIAMWDFSWLERRWPGAGYEDWDQALDELSERGYDAVRIDAYPHLTAADPDKEWLLRPAWTTEDWGAPTYTRVRIQPELSQFIRKCADRHIKVGLSSWYRQDENNVRQRITTPQKLAANWIATLTRLQNDGLLDSILYVDLCNEWPIPVWQSFVKPPLGFDDWGIPRSMQWMRTSIEAVRAEFPQLPLLFSSTFDRVENFADHDISFFDAIEHHLWMTGENDDEFYKIVGYKYERFSLKGYHNLQMKAADTYARSKQHWQDLLRDKIVRTANAARKADKPLMTTECWAIVDYKDWPLLPWDWVKELCEIGVRSASATGQWVAMATSNFCGPQFHGMWRDVAWHQRLTGTIKSGQISPALQQGRLWERL